MKYHSGNYVGADEIGAWLGRSGAWIRLLRQQDSKYAIPCPVPLPEPDMLTEKRRRRGESIALWRRDRLPEFEEWFRAHVRTLAEQEIATMEANVARMKQTETS
jgi:hypothetical protein